MIEYEAKPSTESWKKHVITLLHGRVCLIDSKSNITPVLDDNNKKYISNTIDIKLSRLVTTRKYYNYSMDAD